MTADTAELWSRIEGSVGRITLQRPDKLNALTLAMVQAMTKAMTTWRDDDRVTMVLVDAEGDRAFCAGGDIRALYHRGADGDLGTVRRFFLDEYPLNALIAEYPKPYVALMDGITLGGGVGIGSHGSHRIVTERSMLAMPECAIGMVPDVGATHLLAQAPGYIGERLAMTGQRLGAADAIHAGLADHQVPADRLRVLVAALVESASPASIDEFAVPPDPASLAAEAEQSDVLFGQADADAVIAGLGASDSAFADAALASIRRASPMSVLLAFELVRRARDAPGVREALVREHRVAARAMNDGDFLEGVRALLIEKDGAPSWRHASVADVPPTIVEWLREPAPDGDLDFV